MLARRKSMSSSRSITIGSSLPSANTGITANSNNANIKYTFLIIASLGFICLIELQIVPPGWPGAGPALSWTPFGAGIAILLLQCASALRFLSI
jgi:hypothetical protein